MNKVLSYHILSSHGFHGGRNTDNSEDVLGSSKFQFHLYSVELRVSQYSNYCEFNQHFHSDSANFTSMCLHYINTDQCNWIISAKLLIEGKVEGTRKMES